MSGNALYDYKGERTADALSTFAQGGFKSGASVPVPPPKAAAAPEAAPTAAPSAAPAAAAPAPQEAKPADGPSDVVILTDANFDKLTSQGEWLLEFYGISDRLEVP